MNKHTLNLELKTTNKAYLCWLLFGVHYAYLGKWGLQILYWFTLGGWGIWALVDLFSMTRKIEKHNALILWKIKELEEKEQVNTEVAMTVAEREQEGGIDANEPSNKYDNADEKIEEKFEKEREERERNLALKEQKELEEEFRQLTIELVAESLKLQPPAEWSFNEEDYPGIEVVKKYESFEEISTAVTKPYMNWRGELKIVGMQYMDKRVHVTENDRIVLIHEPNNEYDPNAVAAYSTEGKKIGYIPKALSIRVHNTLKLAPFHVCYVDQVTDTAIFLYARLGYTQKFWKDRFYRS